MSLQNGLGHEEILADVRRPRARARRQDLQGRRAARARSRDRRNQGQGDDHRRARRPRDGARDAHRRRVQPRRASRSTVSANIMGTMWDKLLINVATGALAGITRLPVRRAVRGARGQGLRAGRRRRGHGGGEGRRREDLRTPIPRGRGSRRPKGCRPSSRRRCCRASRRAAPPRSTSSTARSCAGARSCGVPTPVNQALVACVKGIEHRMQHYADQAVAAAISKGSSRELHEEVVRRARRRPRQGHPVAHPLLPRGARDDDPRGRRAGRRSAPGLDGRRRAADGGSRFRRTRGAPRASRRHDRGPRGARSPRPTRGASRRCRRAATGSRCPTVWPSRSSRRPPAAVAAALAVDPRA